jgi:hypothetical protein
MTRLPDILNVINNKCCGTSEKLDHISLAKKGLHARLACDVGVQVSP